MKALVLADMEGISGIDTAGQISPFGGPGPYPEGCRLMAGDVNVAAEGLLAGGVDTVHVRDLHLMGNNLRTEDLIPKVRLLHELPEDTLAEEYALSEGMQILARQPDRAASPEAREEWARELQQYVEAWLASLSGPWEEWENG